MEQTIFAVIGEGMMETHAVESFAKCVKCAAKKGCIRVYGETILGPNPAKTHICI